ncbi:OmpH family outer membrane protein [Pontibacter beigongshangensis]|uniref:OmpH family outer membrane protein n=1 Tax=Pontibacter beigongshangensis TaxID=2574733 RepID=UPI00293C1160|nr:OmpH family outer membrane protein [Pontibacter beigongshangensis]
MKVRNYALGFTMTALLMSACQNDQNKQADKTAAATVAQQAATDTTAAGDVTGLAASEKIVYINTDTLLTNYQYFKDVSSRLKNKAQKTEQNLRSQAEAFQKEVAKYQQTGAGMTAEQQASTEQKLAQKQQQIQERSQKAGNDIATEESEEMKKLYDRVEDYLKIFCEQNGYKMVLSYARGNSAILYGVTDLDVTPEVLKGLNEEYEQEKAAAKKK